MKLFHRSVIRPAIPYAPCRKDAQASGLSQLGVASLSLPSSQAHAMATLMPSLHHRLSKLSTCLAKLPGWTHTPKTSIDGLFYYVLIFKNVKYLIPFNKHPRRNLPPSTSKKRTEADFVLAFGRTYSQEFTDKHTDQDRCFEIARELYIPGLGIADIVSVFVSPRKIILHAFEMKIKDWRKALAQAYRYRYYADAVFVVLPPDEAIKAQQSLQTFRAMNVGLWAFDKEEGFIERIYTPKKDKPLSDSANNKALTLLGQHLKSLPVS